MTSRATDSPASQAAPAAARPASRRDERATVLAVTLITIAVLSLIAANLVFSASARYHVTYQSASWQEALIAAEAGVDFGMNELRKRVVNGPGDSFLASGNWNMQDANGQAFPERGRAFPANGQPFLVSRHGGEGNSLMSARVYVDVPGSDQTPLADNSFAQQPPSQQRGSNFNQSFLAQPDDARQRDADGVDRSRWWYRIRALGIAGVSGPTRTNLDGRDNRLRKFSFFTDWRTDQPVPSPQVSRLVEVVAKPLTNFRNALMGDTIINLSSQDVLVDSYDSTKGFYDPNTNVGTMGNLATNGKLINAGSATVMGDAMTNAGTVQGGEKVTGQQRSDFYQELPPVAPLTGWESVPTGFTVTGNATYTASLDSANPTRVKLSGINLPTGGKTVALVGPPRGLGGLPGNTPSYIKVYVQGDIITRGDSAIQIANGVNAIFYFTGNASLIGDGLVNDSLIPGRVLLNGITPTPNANGSLPSRSITIATNQDFSGIIYAPNHDLGLKQTAALSSSGGSGGSGGGSGDSDGESGDSGADDESNLLRNAAINLTPLHKPPALLSGQSQDHANGYNGVYGSFVGRSITVASKTHVHYDEALRNAGPVNHYEIVNWFEDIHRRGAPDSPQPLWWVTAAK